jgi:hypothetical protein
MLSMDPEEWHNRSQGDLKNTQLNTSDGRFLDYPELLAEVGPRYEAIANLAAYREKSASSQAALDRIAASLVEAAPDVVVIVGDDQRELFSAANQPMVAIFHGESIVMGRRYVDGRDVAPWLKMVAKGYAMDDHHHFAAAPTLALELIERLADRGFDVAAVDRVQNPQEAAFGHAYGFVVKRLFGGRAIPVLPILLNTYYRPNVPSPTRCFALGRALRETLEASPSDARVAVIASGGLSHFIVDEALDRHVLEGLSPGGSDLLKSLPRGALNEGSSEILNWITVAGVLENVAPAWTEYYPVYRTPAGTGVGVAFAAWPVTR